MLSIINYTKYSDTLNINSFISRVLVDAYYLSSLTLTPEELHKILQKFFKATKFDTISQKRLYNPDVIFPISLDVNNTNLIGTPEDILELSKYFPKTVDIYPYLTDYILRIKGINNSGVLLNQNILNINLLGTSNDTSKFYDFLKANKALNIYQTNVSDFLVYNSLISTAQYLFSFLNNYEENYLDANDYFDGLFINYLQLIIPPNLSRLEFNVLMSNIYSDFGFGTWSLNLNITRSAGVFVTDQNNYDIFRKSFVSLEEWSDVMDTISDYYRISIYDSVDLSIPLCVKMYKDYYGVQKF
jgi:hypothetical protein